MILTQHFLHEHEPSYIEYILKVYLSVCVLIITRSQCKGSNRVVMKISSFRVNTTSRQGIKQLGISFGSIFLLFSYESSRGPHS